MRSGNHRCDVPRGTAHSTALMAAEEAASPITLTNWSIQVAFVRRPSASSHPQSPVKTAKHRPVTGSVLRRSAICDGSSQ